MGFLEKLDSLKIAYNFSVSFNPHKSYYESFDDYVSFRKIEESVITGTDPEKDIWEIQVYPNTPISFILVIGNDLDELLDLLIEELTVNPPKPFDKE